MKIAFGRWLIVLLVLMSFVGQAFARQSSISLTPYLQAELTEIALLTAQSNYLQQHNDPLGAAVVASYVPDHQMQATMLSNAIRAAGGDPTKVKAESGTPFVGKRLAIVRHDLAQHRQAQNLYLDLMKRATDPETKQLATLGFNGASRHFSSLTVAEAATVKTRTAQLEGLLAALTLERGTIVDLQTQAARLQQLGDQNTATILLNQVPAHQQQVNSLASLVTQMGGNPALAVAPPTAALPTRNDILLHQQVLARLFINTYALPATAFPGTAIQTLSLQGQNIQVQTMAALGVTLPTKTV